MPEPIKGTPPEHALTGTPAAKWQALQHLLTGLGAVATAYSGGVDSSFLAYAAFKALGERMLAVTVQSELETPQQIERAARFAAEVGFPFLTITFSPLQEPLIAQNPPNRCYYCKREILQRIRQAASPLGFPVVVEGQNLDDETEYRPGRKAVKETGTLSPLVEVGFTKAEIRQAARTLGLSVWDLPSSPCLATRFPYGEALCLENLQRVARAENFLQQKGFLTVRVRAHKELARIEVPAQDFPALLAEKAAISIAFKELGFQYTTLDLEGYRQGSFDKGLDR